MSEVREARVALWRAIESARQVDDRRQAEAILEKPAIALARAVARCRGRELAATADLEHVESVASEAVWAALPRINLVMDTPQVIRYLADRANHAVSDAAREADPLPRRARTYRNRVLTAAQAGAGERTVREVAGAMYPHVTRRTMELIVLGAPPVVDVHRPDIEPSLASPSLDPSEQVVADASIDALHVSMADQDDPGFRAWAAKVLCGENDGRRVPSGFAGHTASVRHRLAAWA